MTNPQFYREIKKYKSIMRDYIDQANDLLDDSDIEIDIGAMVSCSTRKKILEGYYIIFKEISNNNPDIINIINTKLRRLTKLVKLHFYQLKKLKQNNTEQNIMFFLSLHKAVLTFVVCCNKNKIIEKGI
mgnify:CR=1 FL=1|tara:strand:- start:366 stop:752 length:387 start_codon:yes stop_codon:yes gene_type:complete